MSSTLWNIFKVEYAQGHTPDELVPVGKILEDYAHWLEARCTESEQSPMSREDLIFAIAQAHGMISRLISNFEGMVVTPNATTTHRLMEDIAEAQQMQQEFLRRFYGTGEEEENKHD